MTDTVLLNISDNEGYSPSQITNTVSLGDLLQAVQEAAELYGNDAKVVLSNGQRYGAGYGALSQWDDLFTLPEGSEDEDGL